MNFKVVLVLAAIVLLIGGLKVYGFINAPDIQCTSSHVSPSNPPEKPRTAMDYFDLGNYHYDIGECGQAVADYTKSIELDSNYPQAYNNRAYTNMRLRNYEAALPDLDKALALKPNYPQALMNRGDIHNYYFQIDRKSAIADYNQVIALGEGKDDKTVCGHKSMAMTNNFIPLAFLQMFTDPCK